MIASDSDVALKMLIANQIASIHWITEKAREFQKSIYFCFTDYAKPLTVSNTANYGKCLTTLSVS